MVLCRKFYKELQNGMPHKQDLQDIYDTVSALEDGDDGDDIAEEEAVHPTCYFCSHIRASFVKNILG